MSHLTWTEADLKRYTDRLAGAIHSAPRPLHTPREADIKTSRQKASPGKAKTGSKESPLEAMLDKQMALAGIPGYVRQYKHIPGRRLTLDFAFPDKKIGIEVQGMCHRIKAMFERDIEKRALATLAGWVVLEVSGSTIRSGQALEWIAALINGQPVCKPGRESQTPSSLRPTLSTTG